MQLFVLLKQNLRTQPLGTSKRNYLGMHRYQPVCSVHLLKRTMHFEQPARRLPVLHPRYNLQAEEGPSGSLHHLLLHRRLLLLLHHPEGAQSDLRPQQWTVHCCQLSCRHLPRVHGVALLRRQSNRQLHRMQPHNELFFVSEFPSGLRLVQ